MGAAAAVLVLPALAGIRSADARARHHAGPVASVAVLTVREFRVAVVARRLGGAVPPTAEVRIAAARRVGSSWREFKEKRLGETYFWNTVSGSRAVCRPEISTASSRRAVRPNVTVQLLLSPSLGCGRTYRMSLTSTGAGS
jgi:hypothetical protein